MKIRSSFHSFGRISSGSHGKDVDPTDFASIAGTCCWQIDSKGLCALLLNGLMNRMVPTTFQRPDSQKCGLRVTGASDNNNLRKTTWAPVTI